MYRLREMDIDDKVCEQVSMTMLSEVYPKEVIERCVQQSEPWSAKVRRVRLSTALTLVFFVIAMAASEPAQPMPGVAKPGRQAKLSPSRRAHQYDQRFGTERTPPGTGQPGLAGSDARALSGDGPALAHAQCFLWSLSTHGHRWHAVQHPRHESQRGGPMPRSSNQYGPGAYPQVRCVLLAECGSHAVVGLEIDGYEVSEVHGAHRLLEQIGPEMLVLVDAGITSGGFLEHVREQRAHALGALEAGAWEHLSRQRRLADGSVLAWVGPTHKRELKPHPVPPPGRGQAPPLLYTGLAGRSVVW